MVVLDTSIIIDHLRQLNKKDSVLEKLTNKFGADKMVISMATIQELYTGKSVEDPERETLMLNTIAPFEIQSYSYEIARKAGELVRELGSKLQFADAVIAATAIVNGAQLATLNKKDFAGIKNLSLF